MIALITASLALVTWIYLLCARGGFWRAAERDGGIRGGTRNPNAWPHVIAVIPARDEADVIGESVTSLLQQDYGGALSLIVVDDHSSDSTSAVVRRAALLAGASDRVTILQAPDLREGWTGKLSALNHGVEHAVSSSHPPQYLLLTDADIRHAADTLSALVVRMERDRLVLASLMAKLHCESAAERTLIPAFVFFFQMLYPFSWVNSAHRKTAAAAGGCMLVHRESFQKAGGIAAIRDRLIDDCALARLMKSQGRIFIGLTERVRSARVHPTFGAIRSMIVRCAFTELGCSPWLLATTIVAMLVVFVAPPSIALFGNGMARVAGMLAWLLMTASFQPMLRFYRRSFGWGLALPAIALCYVALTVDSALQHLRGRGGEWKGRVQGRSAPLHAGSRASNS